MEERSNQQLVRAIGQRSAILLVITSVIGTAIFLTPGTMAAALPSEPLLLLAWVAGGVIALCGGLTYAEMGAMYPRSGGLYVFLDEAFGPLVAFLYGWTGLLIILTGATAAVAVGFATYLGFFFPALSTAKTILVVPLPWGPLAVSAGQMVAAVSILALGALNYAGVETGNRTQALLTVVKIAVIAILPVLAIALHPAAVSLRPILPPVAHPAAAFGVVMIAVMWAYEGWYYLPFCAGEIADPQRTLPRALLAGIAAITAIYIVVNIAYMLALPLDRIRGVERIAETAATALIGGSGAWLVAATVALSALACNAATVLAVSRACYAMAAGGLFFQAAARVHPKYRTPHIAIALTCGWAALLTLSGTYEQLFTWVTFASVAFGALGGIAIFRLRRIKPEVPRVYRTWGYPVVPALFVMALAALFVNTLFELPLQSAIGIAIVALGWPAYKYWTRTPRRANPPVDSAGCV